jgi:RNA polymerase sigma-70 factor, ECF subfamily
MDATAKQQILNGDLDLYGDFVREHQGMLIGYALRRLGDWRLAEEVVQLTFIRAYQKLDEFRPEQEFGVWLCVTCKYLILTELEKQRRESRNKGNFKESLSIDIADAMAGLGDEDAGSDLVTALRECVTKLQKEAASLIELKYFRKQSCKEIAEAKGRTVTWVTSTLSRTRQALKTCLAKQNDLQTTEGA